MPRGRGRFTITDRLGVRVLLVAVIAMVAIAGGSRASRPAAAQAAPDFATEGVDPAALCLQWTELPNLRPLVLEERDNSALMAENPDSFSTLLRRGRVSGFRSQWVHPRLVDHYRFPEAPAQAAARRQSLANEPYLIVFCAGNLFGTSVGAHETVIEAIAGRTPPAQGLVAQISRPAVGDDADAVTYLSPEFDGTCIFQVYYRVRNVALDLTTSTAAAAGPDPCSFAAAQGVALMQSLERGLAQRLKPRGDELVGCLPAEQLAFHVHVHLAILIEGEPVEVPALIGITPGCFRFIHTHDSSGILHVEAPALAPYTLGDFFRVWGQRLDHTHLLDRTVGGGQEMRVTLNGRPFDGPPEDIILYNLDNIVIQLGPPFAPPPSPWPWTPGYLPTQF